MGQIHANIYTQHLSIYPENEEILRPFLNGFDITYANEKDTHNSRYFFYFFKPEQYIEESFGFSREILAIYSPYDRMEPRTIQTAEQILKESPALGRVEYINFILISEALNIEEWVKEYISQYNRHSAGQLVKIRIFYLL